MPKVEQAPQQAGEPKEDLSFSLDMDLWGPDHIKRCRERFPHVPYESFVNMMRRAKKLERDPMTDIWLSSDGNFLMHAHAMFEYASKTGNYAPGTSPAVFEMTDERGPTNPHGLHRCVVTIRVKSSDGTWHDCPGEAFWSDLVPLANARFDNATGMFIGGVVSNTSGWASMPHTLLKKCAYVDALKKAFPELAAFYVREERDQTAAIEQQRPPVAQGQSGVFDDADPTGGERQDQRTYFIPVNWLDNDSEMVPDTDFYDRVSAFLNGEIDEGRPERVVEWFRVNEKAREDFWVRDQHLTKRRNAVALKKLLGAAQEAMQEQDRARGEAGSEMSPSTLARPRRVERRKVEPVTG